jgi:butyryl-CoA dehydrogenase
MAEHGAVHLVANNAGVALGAPVATMSEDDFRWLMDINFWGVVHGTQAFLPHLEASADGPGTCHVVNVSSVFGLVPIPTQSAYNASKYAVRGFTESLRMELELAGSPVTATVVHPGGIRTNIVRNARIAEDLSDVAGTEDERATQFDRIARTTPEQAARVILAAVDRNERRVLVGPDARFFDLLSRLPAGVQQRVVTAAARRRT